MNTTVFISNSIYRSLSALGLQKGIVSLLLAVFSLSSAFSQPPPEISVLTCSPGEELYSAFGHTAIRVRDDSRNLDLVYNYGTFDFSTRFFYIKFASGRLKYQLSVSRFNDFLYEYILEGREVFSQQLLLSDEAKWRLLQLLQENHQSANRFYYYDFFKDNCTTRVRDIIAAASGTDSLYSEMPTPLTYRQLIYPYLEESKWVRAGIDLLLGQPTDVETSIKEQAFLPLELMNQLDTITSRGLPLVDEAIQLYVPEKRVQEKKAGFPPLITFIVLLALSVLMLFWEIKMKRPFSYVNKSIFFIAGLVGLFLVVMWMFSWHYPVRYNFNVLWMNPLFLLCFFGGKRVKLIFTLFIAFFLLLFLLTGSFMMQHFNQAFYPLAVFLLLRLLSQMISLKKPEKAIA